MAVRKRGVTFLNLLQKGRGSLRKGVVPTLEETMALQNKDTIIAFLEQPDISYCASGRKDTAYSACQMVSRFIAQSTICSTHITSLYLYSIKKAMYYQVREIIPSEKHLVMQGKISEDDCRCEAFENAELFLQSVKVYFNKDNSIMNYHLCMETIYVLNFHIFTFFSYFYILVPSSNHPVSILKSLFWEIQKQVEAKAFFKDKMFCNVGMLVHPKTMLIYILYFSPIQDDQRKFLEKHSFSCNAKNLSHFFNITPVLTFFSLAKARYV